MVSNRILPAAIMMAIAAGLFFGFAHVHRERGKALVVGMEMPTSLLSAVSKWRPIGANGVVIFYGDPDCPHCRAELSRWSSGSGARLGRNPDLRIVVVARDRVGVLAGEASGVVLDTLTDPSGELRDAMAVRAYPTTFFVDSRGVLRARHVGEFTDAGLDSGVASILAHPGAGGGA